MTIHPWKGCSRFYCLRNWNFRLGSLKMEEKVVEQKTAVAELRHARISARKVKIVLPF